MSTAEARSAVDPFQPGDYDRPLAFIAGEDNHHVVDTRTFAHDGGRRGTADALCGRTVAGQLVPLDGDDRVLRFRICGNCLRSLERGDGGDA